MGTRALASMALVAALGTGCAGDPEPKIADPSPSPTSASPSVSASVTEAADPEQAYRDFIDSYVAAISDSLSTGDPSAWLAMSDPACSNCPIFAKNVTDAYRNGGRIEGADWRLVDVTFAEKTDVGDVYYATVETAEERWLDGEGSLVKVVDASTNYLAFALGGAPGELKVNDLRFREP